MLGVVGNVASQVWQAARDAQGGDRVSAGSSAEAAPSSAIGAAPSSATGAASTTGAAPGSSIGADGSKLISDLQSLLLNLQSDGSTKTGGPTNASSDPAAAVQADLATLSQDQAKLGGGHHTHHHHRGGAPAGGNDASSSVAPASGGTSTPQGHDAGLVGTVAKAIKAYERSAGT